METDSTYDLGDVGGLSSGPSIRPSPSAPTFDRPIMGTGVRSVSAARTQQLRVANRPTWTSPVLIPASVALVMPGGGHLLQGRFKAGIAWLGATVFLAAGSAAVWSMLPRLWKALGVMGLRPESTVWALAGFAGLLMVLQVTSVLSARAYRAASRPVHPVVACAASVVTPGWGQTLNGDLVRAGLFLSATWVTAASWLMGSTPFQEFLAAYQLGLPELLTAAVAAPTSWALTAALWPLAVYDAGVSAHLTRR
jgi:hypothetical protein